jgi:hypothetical protein
MRFRVAILAVVLAALLPRAGEAQRYPLWDAKRLSLTATAGYMGFKVYDSPAPPWAGATLGAQAGYNVGAFTGFVGYERGQNLQPEQDHRNLLRAYLNLKTAELGGWDFYAGGGVMSMGRKTARDWSGAEGHLNGSVPIAPRVRFTLTYAHAFSLRQEPQEDFDFYRAGLVAKLSR